MSTTATPTPLFPPTLREVMLRPRWIGMLLFCLLVAGVFAWLGQWQLARAINTGAPAEGVTEIVEPIDAVVKPSEYLQEPLVGQMVSVDGSFVADDFYVVSGRFDDGTPGYWVTGQLRTEADGAPASIAVAVGFEADREDADAAMDVLNAAPPQDVTITGRIISDEGAMAPSRSQPVTEMARMSTAQLVNLWHDADGLEIYRPFLTSTEAFGGLKSIHSPAPQLASPVNWLNIFYAAEWVVFAGFAFYLWYRLAKDAWEREVEGLDPSDPDSLLA